MLVAYVEEQTHIPFDLAERRTGIPAELLRKLVRDGVLAGSAPYRVAGLVGWCDIEQAQQLAERLRAARAPVEGQGISVVDAAEKYGFGRTSIYQWFDKGWVHVVGTTPNGDRLFNEGDIAFARALADLTNHTRGKVLLPKKLN